MITANIARELTIQGLRNISRLRESISHEIRSRANWGLSSCIYPWPFEIDNEAKSTITAELKEEGFEISIERSFIIISWKQ